MSNLIFQHHILLNANQTLTRRPIKTYRTLRSLFLELGKVVAISTPEEFSSLAFELL